MDYEDSDSDDEDQPCCDGPESLRVDNIAWQFLRDSSLHGFKYVGTLDRTLVERFFWTLSIVGCMGFSVYLIQIGVVDPLTASPVMISFQSSDITIDRIPFPAITICNVNKIKKSVVEEQERLVDAVVECERLYGSETYRLCSNETISLGRGAVIGIQYLMIYCKRVISFAKHLGFSSLIGTTNYDIEQFYGEEYQNLTLVLDNSSQEYRIVAPIINRALTNCSEMILLCLWQNKKYPCNEMLYPTHTEFGRCCVFNMVPRSIRRGLPDKFPEELSIPSSVWDAWSRWNIDEGLVIPEKSTSTRESDIPKHQHMSGMKQGLSILVNPQLAEYHCTACDSTGFRIMAHSPIERPQVSEFGNTVEPHSETFAALTAEITNIDPNVKTMSPEKRKCYLQGEFTLQTSVFYTAANCLDECVANSTFKTCGCLRYYQPRLNTIPLCGSGLDICVEREFSRIDKIGLHKMCPMCYPSCTAIQYKMETSKLPIRHDIPIWTNSFGFNEAWSNKNVSIIHFYFNTDYVETRLRKSLYGFRQILANAGGLLGLTIGFSIISLVEPFYFFTLRCICYNRNNASQETQPNDETDNTSIDQLSDKIIDKVCYPTQFRTQSSVIKRRAQIMWYTQNSSSAFMGNLWK